MDSFQIFLSVHNIINERHENPSKGQSPNMGFTVLAPQGEFPKCRRQGVAVFGRNRSTNIDGAYWCGYNRICSWAN
jgi:hypothetical protein